MTSLPLKSDRETCFPSWSGRVKSGAFFPSSILLMGIVLMKWFRCNPTESRAYWSRRNHMRFAALPFVLLLSCAGAQETPEAGWKELFNGKDLEGWVTKGSAVWRVENGIIAGGQDGDPKRSGVLITKDEYKDFELALDFMIDEHGKYNS